MSTKNAIRGFLALGCISCWAGAPNERGLKLEELKREFPSHVAGAVDEKSDPIIVAAWEKYHTAVEELQLDNLAEGVGKIRRQIEFDISHAEYKKKYPDEAVKTASLRAARQQNLAWLKLKLLPYVKRLEQFQRGR